jgi:hypothetical protein
LQHLLPPAYTLIKGEKSMNFATTVFAITYLIVLVIALFVTSKITKNQKVKMAVIGLWLIAPTWDILLGYPVYYYLAKYQSGIKIYKKIDHVEGFYVGEKNWECAPDRPFNGYRYIDYKDKQSGKYYRKYRYGGNTSNRIGKTEIDRSAISTFCLYDDHAFHQHASFLLSLLNITQPTALFIKNKRQNQELGELNAYRWEGSWIARVFSSIDVEPKGAECGPVSDNPNAVFLVNSILKSNKSKNIFYANGIGLPVK